MIATAMNRCQIDIRIKMLLKIPKLNMIRADTQKHISISQHIMHA
jgi:hypothetical protein